MYAKNRNGWMDSNQILDINYAGSLTGIFETASKLVQEFQRLEVLHLFFLTDYNIVFYM